MYYISLRYNNTEESDDKHIILSYKYVAQRAMESTCRWVNAIYNSNLLYYKLIVTFLAVLLNFTQVQIEFGDSGAVRNCTLEDIDAICIEFQSFELYTTLHGWPSGTNGIASYASEVPNSPEMWFNCTRSQNQEQLRDHPDAVTHILEKVRSS